MKRKLIAIATADWHIHKFNAFNVGNSRLKWCIKSSQDIMARASFLKVPILFAGDLIHSPKHIENETNAEVQNMFRKMKCQMFAVSGNHDMCERNTNANRSPSHFDAIQGNVTPMHKKILQFQDFALAGLDYTNNDLELKANIIDLSKGIKVFRGTKILLLHTDIPGAKTPEGFEIGEVESIPKNLDKFFSAWDLVLCGHIHKKQKISNKVYMLGCPIHQTESNIGQKCGYWHVYSDASMKFVELGGYPKFIRLGKGEEKPQNSINYHLEYDEVLAEEQVEMGEFNINNSKTKLAKSYVALKNIKSKTKRNALIKILNEE